MKRIPPCLRIYLVAVLVFFLPTTQVSGQDKYIIRHYTNENGLPANSINSLELDKESGFLWVGTQAGLVRFDGADFKDFRSAKNSAAVSRIYTIAKNLEGTIFCEDDNFSVYRIKEEQPKLVMIDTIFVEPFLLRGGSFQLRSVKQVAEKLKHHNRASFLPHWIVFYDQPGDSSSFIFQYLEVTCHYDAARDTILYFNNDLHFRQVVKLDGRMYLIRDNLEIWEYDARLMKRVQVHVEGMPAWNKESEKPRWIWKRGMKEPLLLYKQDIWKLQRTKNGLLLQPLCRECSPADVHINSVQLWEEQGLLFLGSLTNGLYVSKKSFLHTIRTDSVIKEIGRTEYAQAEMIPGLITTPYGLSFSPEGKLIPDKTRTPYNIFSFYQDQQGDGWSHSMDTVLHFNRNNSQPVQIGLNNQAFRMVFTGSQDRVYAISDMTIGEITDDRYRLLYRLPTSGRGLKNSINPDAAIEWQPGILAIAGEKVLLFDTRKKTAPDTIPIPGLTVKVRALRKYGDYLLIGTYGQGFYMYKNGIVKKMPPDKNGYLNYAHCFMPDANGFCWISTNHGLFKTSLQALVQAYERNLPEIYYHYFGKSDGIYNTEFNGGCQPCALQLSTGLFSFPSMNGLVVLDPLAAHAPPPAGKLFVEEIVADTASFQLNSKALQSLPAGLQNLSFQVAMSRFGNPENINFSYRLEPYHKNWVTHNILQNNVLQFGGLPSGRYKLYLRVRNGFAADQFAVTEIAFRILTPWYHQWWFYLLCVFGLLLLVWLLIRWRTATINHRKQELQRLVFLQTENLEAQSEQLAGQLHQLQSLQAMLEEDNKIKARLIAIISHDMISPLKFMGFMAKKLRGAFPDSHHAYQTANSFVTVTQELESLSVNMLNWIRFHHEDHQLKTEQFNLRQLVTESTEIAAALAAEKGIKLRNDMPENIGIWQFRQALGVIIYNLVMNAVKYTEKGEIRITGEISGNQFSLTLSDTGKGMSPQLVDQLNKQESIISDNQGGEIKKFRFGYPIIKDLLKLVRGTLSVESTVNEGTRVTILCPWLQDQQ